MIIGHRGRFVKPLLRASRLNRPDFRDARRPWCGHLLVHRSGLVAFHEVALVTVSVEQRFQFRLRNARQHGGTGDLIPVQVQDRQHGAVARRIQKFIRMPAGGAGASLGFAIAHHAAGQQTGIVEHRAIGMQHRIPKLAAFVDRTRRFRRSVARNAARKRKLAE